MSICLRRSEFIAGLGGATAWPLAVRAQQPVPVIGYLSPLRPGVYAEPEFLEGLGEVGFVEGRNVVIEYHWANGDYGLFPALAADLVRRRVSAIYAGTTPAALAAKAATTSIPIVFAIGGDPVKLGLVASMNRPGGNLTGFTGIGNALTAKRLELLRDLVPQAETIAFLVNPTNQNAESDTQDVQAAARAIGRRILVVAATNEQELDRAFATIVNETAGALLVASGGRSVDPLRPRYRRISRPRRVCWPDSQGREARRPAGPAAHPVRAGDQPQDGQDTWSDGAADAARHCHRGDRITA